MNRVYSMVAERIIKKLREGVVPWRRPWSALPAVNWVTQRPYRGINTLLLESGEYATFKQITLAGGRVKKGSKGHLVVFWKMLEMENGEEKEKTIPYLRYYHVFEINRQCEGLRSKVKRNKDHSPMKDAEKLLKEYKDPPLIFYAPGKAFYRPTEDLISLPEPALFHSSSDYYNTLFHELIHSTGHAKRLNRKAVSREHICFGDHLYSQEELIAEIGAAMLCAVCGINTSAIENSVAYIKTWMEKVGDDPKCIVYGASKAQKAADYVQGVFPSRLAAL